MAVLCTLAGKIVWLCTAQIPSFEKGVSARRACHTMQGLLLQGQNRRARWSSTYLSLATLSLSLLIFKGCCPSKMNSILKRRRGCAATSHGLPIKNASHALRWSARSCTVLAYQSVGKLPSSYKELCVLRYGETPVSGRPAIRCACISGPSCLPR